MPRDRETAIYEAHVTVVLTTQNRYGDTLQEGGQFTFIKKIRASSLREVAEVLDRLDIPVGMR